MESSSSSFREIPRHHHYGDAHVIEKLLQSIEIWYATSEYFLREMNMVPVIQEGEAFTLLHALQWFVKFPH